MLKDREETARCQSQVDGGVEGNRDPGSNAALLLPPPHGLSPLSATRPMRATPAFLKASKTDTTWP